MLLRQLEYFAAINDTGSFTKAAQRCFVSQSAISQQVKSLEEELGCPLLERHGRSFSLTPAGERALAAAHDVMDRVARMRFEVEHASQTERVALRVGYLSRFRSWEVQGAVAAFTVRHPDIDVTARAGTHEDLYEMMLAGTIDMAFSDRRRELSGDFANIHLVDARTVIEVSEANPLAQREQVNVSELASSTCILVAQGDARAAERAYYRDVLNFPCPFVFAPSLDEAHLMVAGNRGFLPLEELGGAGAGAGVIRHIPLMGASGQLVREYYAFWPKARGNWLTQEFTRILQELLVRGSA